MKDPGQAAQEAWSKAHVDEGEDPLMLVPWSELSRSYKRAWAACSPPNQLTSSELGKMVEDMERDQQRRVPSHVAQQWLPRVREAWLALLRWEADHG